MAKKNLDQKIVKKLASETGKSEATVKKDIYLMVKKYPTCTKNALAQLYATANKKTVFRMLTQEDKATLPNNLEIIQKPVRIAERNNHIKEKIIPLIVYESSDHFIKGHIQEVNRCYNKNCYTAAFILCRKVVENLIIDILKAKYPATNKENKEVYFDTAKGRFKDFSVILSNLQSKKHDFGINKTIVERLISRANKLKDDANDKTHSWFHLVKSKQEIDDLDAQSIIELIKKLQ